MEQITETLVELYAQSHPLVQPLLFASLLLGFLFIFWRLCKFHSGDGNRLVPRGQEQSLRTRLEQANRSLEVATKERDELRNEVSESVSRLNEYTSKMRDREQSLEERKSLIEELNRRHEWLTERKETLESTIESVANGDGRIWERPVAHDAPSFQLRTPGKAWILSFLNLKGGVGKTTLSANLAATWAAQGKRVLLLDLDYQVSLSRLCLTRHAIQHVEEHPATTACALFEGCAEEQAEFIKANARIIGDQPQFRLLPTEELLVEVENRVMAQWLVKHRDEDIRFCLRRALHHPEIRESFDFIIIDCPPRLTTACVNALCASDRVVVPTLFDANSADAVPRVMRQLLRFSWIDGLLGSGFRVVGVIGNKVKSRNGNLVAIQEIVRQGLVKDLNDFVHDPIAKWPYGTVPVLDTAIKESSKVANHRLTERAEPAPDESENFSKLIEEIETRLMT